VLDFGVRAQGGHVRASLDRTLHHCNIFLQQNTVQVCENVIDGVGAVQLLALDTLQAPSMSGQLWPPAPPQPSMSDPSCKSGHPGQHINHVAKRGSSEPQVHKPNKVAAAGTMAKVISGPAPGESRPNVFSSPAVRCLLTTH
jgi:hypothetical protein